MEIIKTGEFFVPNQSTPYEIKVNIERYLFVLQFISGKKVLDAGHGAGLGTYLYSLVAKNVIAVDYNDTAQEFARSYPIGNNVEYMKLNLDEDDMPAHEVTVALESLEHLNNPEKFLSGLKSEKLIFSLPLNSLSTSTFHKYDIRSVDDVKNLIGKSHELESLHVQENKWVYGVGHKK
jgi:2-polyprenyl-3-methyl-5-hydroxy-6-metoxy-1,4-benzoquinol methylase